MALSPSRLLRTGWLAALAVGAALWFWSPVATAGSSGTWTITEMSGRVDIVRTGAAPVALTMGDELRPGDMIETAAGSSAILVRNGESIVVAPNSRMGLPSTNDSGFSTLILQQFGTLLLKVEKQQQRHFEVRTPYLAAVVKGTTFTVNVDAAGAAVHVLEGAVQVANQTGIMSLVRPGQTAIVSSTPGAGLSIKGGPATAPSQRSDGAQDQDNSGQGKSAAEPKAAKTASIGNSPGASNAAPAALIAAPTVSTAAPKAFKIKNTVGPGNIDVAAVTKGLVREAPGVGQVRRGSSGNDADKNSGKGTGNKGASNGTASIKKSGGGAGSAQVAGSTGAAKSSVSGNLGSAVGNPGGAPAGAKSKGSPPAAGPAGGKPAAAAMIAQVTATAASLAKKLKKEKPGQIDIDDD